MNTPDDDLMDYRQFVRGADRDSSTSHEHASAAARRAVDVMFRARAERALGQAGVTALEFFDSNPSCTILELAKRLNRGANAIGLGTILYAEAQEAGRLCEVAKALFTAKIIDEFADGWNSTGSIHPLINVGSWSDGIRKGIADPRFLAASEQILRKLTIDDPPPEGWKPEAKNDPRIESLFDRFWPES